MSYQLQQNLKEAEAAYHLYQTGRSVVSITKNDRAVEYNRANIHQLKTYIDDLKAQLGISNTRRRRPAGGFC